MSYRVTVEIACDHKGCLKIWKDSRINRGGLSKTWAGYMARERGGWFTQGHPGGPSDPTIAYCPDHRYEHGHPA